MVSDAGTWRGAQSRAAEAGGWRVCTSSRWTEFCARRGSGERVQHIEVMQQQTVTDEGAVGWMREIERSRKTVETGGAGGPE